jgi:hypothetical protein
MRKARAFSERFEKLSIHIGCTEAYVLLQFCDVGCCVGCFWMCICVVYMDNKVY